MLILRCFSSPPTYTFYSFLDYSPWDGVTHIQSGSSSIKSFQKFLSRYTSGWLHSQSGWQGNLGPCLLLFACLTSRKDHMDVMRIEYLIQEVFVSYVTVSLSCKDSSEVEKTDCSRKQPEFSSHHSRGVSSQAATLAPGCPMLYFGLFRHLYLYAKSHKLHLFT